jgi:D-sedoheptulose 7-phosphate isomerase
LKATKHTSVEVQPLRASREYLAELRGVLDRLDTTVVDRITEAIWEGYEQGRTLFIFGNGGSAALASHFVCDIGKGTVAPGRRRLRAISLTDNVPLMTAWANDTNYGEIFAEQLHGLVEKNDLVLAISGSGNSENVVRGLQVARAAGAKTLALTGFSGGRVKALADLCLIVPSDNMQHIEDAHLFSAHAIFSAIRQHMMQANGE